MLVKNNVRKNTQKQLNFLSLQSTVPGRLFHRSTYYIVVCNLEFVIYLDSTIELNSCLHEGILMNEVKLSQIKYLKVFLWYFVYLTEHFMYRVSFK